jgi:hypothetical protein
MKAPRLYYSPRLPDSGYIRTDIALVQPGFTNYSFPRSFQDHYSTRANLDLKVDITTNGSFEFYEIWNSDQTQPSRDMPRETYEQDYLLIPKAELKEPYIDPHPVNNGCIDSSIAFRRTLPLPNIPATTTIKDASLNKDVKLQSDSPYSIESNTLSNTENGPIYLSNPQEPTKTEVRRLQELPRKAWANLETGRRSKRRQNITAFDATEFYEPLPETPPSWSSPNSEFQYNKFGELNTRLRLTSEQMLELLYLHPLHSLDGYYNSRNSALTLWLQTVPADSDRRYPSMGSDKCRFVDCPDKHNTIRKGFFRVAIDEQSYSGIRLDPFHSAGFVHLYCLEKFVNFPLLCKELNVRPDNRLLPEPRNKMALARDYCELYRVAEDFIKNSQEQTTWDYTKTLSYKLTMKHLELEPDTRSRKRKRTGGNHLGIHLGDLEVFAENERKKLASRKRRKEDSDEDDVDDRGDQNNNPRPHEHEPS